MIEVDSFYNFLVKKKLSFFAGVPDSLLKDFCAYVDQNAKEQHVVTANEGNAIALAVGQYLQTKRGSVVYMQNSGLGNAVNPLVSLADKSVYSIPMILIVGWRGEPGTKDEPQHMKQGAVTESLLEILQIPFEKINENTKNWRKKIDSIVRLMNREKKPVALLISKGTFSKYKSENTINSEFSLTREESIKIILQNIERKSLVVSTTGKTSRELYDIRKKRKDSHDKDFLCVGSMGHASQIALGIAMFNKNRRVYCLDGDGAVLMHMGSLATIAEQCPNKFTHIIINNNVHDSVGGQKIANGNIAFSELATVCKYKKTYNTHDRRSLEESIKLSRRVKGPALIQVSVRKGSRKDLIRPDSNFIKAKKYFMREASDAKRV